MLGDLGADVVKVEPPAGDPIRRVGALDGGEPRAHRYANRNKRSIVVDPATDDGRATLVALTSVADVVVVNQTDAQLGRWQCTYDEIAARNPARSSCRSPPSAGPDLGANAGGNGSIAEGFGGLAFLNGAADGPPTLPSLALGDTLGAIVGLNGVLAVLVWRALPAGNGRGQLVDASLTESGADAARRHLRGLEAGRARTATVRLAHRATQPRERVPHGRRPLCGGVGAHRHTGGPGADVARAHR